MLVIKKIICTILISTLLIGLTPADTLMYSHMSDEELTEEIKKINKELNDYKKNKMVSQNNISRRQEITMVIYSIVYYILVGLVFANFYAPTILIVLLSVIVWSTIIAMSQIEHITKKLELINKNITHLKKRATILEYGYNERPSVLSFLPIPSIHLADYLFFQLYTKKLNREYQFLNTLSINEWDMLTLIYNIKTYAAIRASL